MPPPIVADTDLPADTDWCDSDDGSDGGGGGCAAGPRPPRGGVNGNEGASKGCTRCNIVATKRRHPRLPSHRLLRSPFGPIESSSRFSCQFATTFRIPFPFSTWRDVFLFFFLFDLVSCLIFAAQLRFYPFILSTVFSCRLERLTLIEKTTNFVPRNWGTDCFGSQFKHHLFCYTWSMVVRAGLTGWFWTESKYTYTLDASLILCILDKEVNTIFYFQREVCPGGKIIPFNIRFEFFSKSEKVDF